MMILKLGSIAVLFLIIGIFLRQIRPEFVPLVQVSSVICFTVVFADYLKKLLKELDEFIGADVLVEEGYVVLLVRMLGIAVVTRVASDMCKDNGNQTLSDCVELFGKVLILSLCFPLIKVMVDLAGGFLA